ncbi:programmed cell death protein 4-like [Watersipora subatra]|uniref:programmed cell death protein 4-like n=1 Tax=Watersipora subatra TaxID=2589382 RepID=UPI00355B197E
MSAEGDSINQAGDGPVQENGGPGVLTASELAEGDVGARRVITGAKALRRSPSKENAYAVALKKALTKDRHQSRSGKGRGAPKKGGAGGKGTWGKPGDELGVDSTTTDIHDPNYDSDGQEEYRMKTVRPVMDDEQFKQFLEDMFHEYFEHGDTYEVIESLKELNAKKSYHKIIQVLINLALDRKATVRELSSVLISDMYGNLLSQEDVSRSFSGVLAELPDLTLDAPEAPVIVGQFIARAIADDCLPPKFVSSFKGAVESAEATLALEKAEVLLSLKHGIVRLDNVWGVGGGLRPVKTLIKKIVLLLKEYLSSGDANEAIRCLLDLEVPHFHHELVYELLILVIESGKEQTATAMAALLKAFYDACYITSDQMAQGFVRVLDNLNDIQLDAPQAVNSFDNFADICFAKGILPNRVLKELPGRGRKRYVSEGDGGRLKENGSSGHVSN